MGTKKVTTSTQGTPGTPARQHLHHYIDLQILSDRDRDGRRPQQRTRYYPIRLIGRVDPLPAPVTLPGEGQQPQPASLVELLVARGSSSTTYLTVAVEARALVERLERHWDRVAAQYHPVEE